MRQARAANRNSIRVLLTWISRKWRLGRPIAERAILKVPTALKCWGWGADSRDRSSWGQGQETATILASVYDRSSGEQTASGESLREDVMTAAHRTLPFGTVVVVNNKENGCSALVRINDRGPFVRGRVIDLTSRAARALGISGVAKVSIEIVSAAAD
jgi:rare lipoprotein A